MKLFITAIIFAMSINSAFANTLQCNATKSDIETSTRMTPFVSINFGDKIVKLGQQLFPSFEGCYFFCLGEKIYVYDQDVFLGIIDKDFGFHCADKVLVSSILPRPDVASAANNEEVNYICSKVFCACE